MKDINLRLILGNQCTQECFFCTHDFNCSESGFMDKEFAIHCIDAFANCKGRRVNFSGGEPTLYPDLLELVQYAKKKNLETNITTNGTRIISLSDELISLIDVFHISIMSVKDEYYQIISNPKEDITIKSIIDNIHRLKSIGKNVKVNTIYLEEYPEESLEVVKFFTNIGIVVRIMNDMNKGNEYYQKYLSFISQAKSITDMIDYRKTTNPGYIECQQCNLQSNCASVNSIWCFPNQVISWCPQKNILKSSPLNQLEINININIFDIYSYILAEEQQK